MRKVLEADKRIAIYGNSKEIEKTEEALKSLNLSKLDESKARLIIQNLIDDKKLNASILFDGNTVWSRKKIMRNLKKIIKKGILGNAEYVPIGNILRIPVSRGKLILSNYFYEFLHLSCGSIAHYDKAGWVAEYPTINDLKNFFFKNEFGEKVLNHIPSWKTDVIKIIKEIETVFKWAKEFREKGK